MLSTIDDVSYTHIYIYIYKRDLRPHPTPCNGVVNHGAQIGGIWVLPPTHAKTNAKQMRPWSWSGVSTGVYLHAQTAVDAGDIHTWWFELVLTKIWICSTSWWSGHGHRPEMKTEYWGALICMFVTKVSISCTMQWVLIPWATLLVTSWIIKFL